MIELRWLTRQVIYNGVSQGHLPDEETVLQFRVLEYVTDSDDYRYQDWSKWKDIPSVKGGPPRHVKAEARSPDINGEPHGS